VKKILVVDDDRTLRSFVARYLENHGYTVQDASSGIEALQFFEQDPPDLVVSDVIMPEMNGLEFCRRLRATRLGQLVPFIFLSGKGELEDRIQGHLMGADDYVTKPFEPRELVAKIEAQLERSRRIHCEIVRLMQQLSPSTANSPSAADLETLNSTQISTASSAAAAPQALPLTPAEARVFWEVIQGLTNKQISDRLFISPRTVQSHLSNILTKLELENRSQLVRFAFERGYQPPTKA